MQRVSWGLKEWNSWQRQTLSLDKRSRLSDLLLLFICIISETSKIRCFVENGLNQQCSGVYYNLFGAFIHKEVGWQMETAQSSVPWLLKFVYSVRSWCLSRVSGFITWLVALQIISCKIRLISIMKQKMLIFVSRTDFSLKFYCFWEGKAAFCSCWKCNCKGEKKTPNNKALNPKQKTEPATKVVFGSRNVIEGSVFMAHLKNIKQLDRCLEITCPCEMEMLMIHEAESHLNVKILLHPYYCDSFPCPGFFTKLLVILLLFVFFP